MGDRLTKLTNADFWDYELPQAVIERLNDIAAALSEYYTVPPLETVDFDGYNTPLENAKTIINAVESNIDTVCGVLDFFFPYYGEAVTWDAFPMTEGLNRWIDIVNHLSNLASGKEPALYAIKYDDDTVVQCADGVTLYYPEAIGKL